MPATIDRKPLGQLLLDKGIVQPEQLARALEEQRRSNHQKLLGEVLVELRFCTEDQIVEALAQVYGVPYARVSPRVADPKVIAILPRDFLEKHQVLPLFLVEGLLTVAVPEPANVFLVEEVERVSGHPVQVVAATTRDIKATLQAYLPDDKVFVIDDIIEGVEPQQFTLIEQKVDDIADLEQAAGDSPVIKLVNYCVYTAVKEGASDIHIEPGEGILRVRFRVDGRLVEKLRPPAQMHAAVASRIKIMAGLDISERRLPQDGGIHVMMDKRPIDLRVSTVPGRHGEKVVVRIIDNEKASVNLEKLGFGYDTLKAWRKLITLPNGILLVTGPTGSGKSTTLYAALQELNRDDVNICTVEDPVEYVMPGINQFQVNEKAGFGFDGALRSLLRQDPDILMIGEIRDVDTGRLATQAALTGHLVLSTLHTNDAPSAFTRLYNLGDRRRGAGPATGPQALPGVQGTVRPRRQRKAADRKTRRPGRDVVQAQGMPQVPQPRLQRPDRHLRTAGARRREDRADQPGRVAERNPRTRQTLRDEDAPRRRDRKSARGDHDAGRGLSRDGLSGCFLPLTPPPKQAFARQANFGCSRHELGRPQAEAKVEHTVPTRFARTVDGTQ
jgi:type IV pilus assembly protein PilB